MDVAPTRRLTGERKGEESIEFPSGARITALADGVFAIVMTLLVLGIDPPRVPEERLDDELVIQILHLWPRIATYVVSFLLLGIYWIGHHTQFHFVRGVNRVVLWLNIFFFMFVCLVPFSTRLLGQYSARGVPFWIYAANFVAISLLLLVHWRYLAAKGLLDESADRGIVAGATRQILFGPAVYLTAIAVSFLDARIALVVILAVPVLHILPGPFHMHWTR